MPAIRPLRPTGSRSPYEALLGEAFDTLHPNVRRAHEAPLNAQGVLDVVHGTHPVTRIVVALMKLPAAGIRIPVVLSVVFGCLLYEHAWLRFLFVRVMRPPVSAAATTGFRPGYCPSLRWVYFCPVSAM